MKKYYFRVDGGNIYSVATGHITRCLKLADFISGKENSQIYFIMKDYKEGVGLVDKKYEAVLLRADADIRSEIDLIKNVISGDSYFICDIRNIDNGYISEIKKNRLKFILFDDLGVKGIEPDILINPAPFCQYGYKREEYPNTKLLLGEKFFFINPSLIDRAHLRDFKKERYNIMASFGGADPCNITEFFIKNIAPQLKEHDISVILGPAYKRKSAIVEKYGNIGNVTFYTDITGLDDMFLSSDIAFVCGGDTCIESCVSGAATFIISSIYYEKSLGQLLDKNKMAYFVADIEDIKSSNVDNKYLKVLHGDEALLSSISKRGMGLIDGNGQDRVYKTIKGEL